MKLDFERRSGLSFDDVRVHYHSEKPAQLQALAYTQGTQVYVAPGQERHLPHELGHVVQQKRGAVRPTAVRGGVPVNESPDLERSAGRLAEAARGPGLQPVLQFYRTPGKPGSTPLTAGAVRQRGEDRALDIPEEKLADYEAHFLGGKLHVGHPPTLVNTKVIFVVSTDQKLYVRPEPGYWGRDAFTHSSFLSGRSVATAGEMHVRGGIITLISNGSGHYQPAGSTLEYLLDLLKAQGADLSHILMEVVGGEPHLYNAGQYDGADTAEDLEEQADTLLDADRKTQDIHDMAAGVDIGYERNPKQDLRISLSAYTEADLMHTIQDWSSVQLVDAFFRAISKHSKSLYLTIFWHADPAPTPTDATTATTEKPPARSKAKLPARPKAAAPSSAGSGPPAFSGPGARDRAKAAFLAAFGNYILDGSKAVERTFGRAKCSVTYEVKSKSGGGSARPPQQPLQSV